MQKEKTVFIIGAGQLGSRHLQALKNVPIPIAITVVDPFASSLSTAKERYESVADEKHMNHTVTYLQELPRDRQKVDLAIIATNSDVRAQVTERLVNLHTVKYLILEKLLFPQKSDYKKIEILLEKNHVKTWVNCSMRTMPFYADMQRKVKRGPIDYIVTGSQYGLVTNAIHYIDHMAFLANCFDFSLDTQFLDPKPITSKRKGFLELNGRLLVHFSDGSIGNFVCYGSGDTPVVVEVRSDNLRVISKESERKAWISEGKNDWKWQEIETNLPFQSQMTTSVVEDILKTGRCALAPFAQSCNIHLALLEPLRKFLNKNTGQQYTYYPFT